MTPTPVSRHRLAPRPDDGARSLSGVGLRARGVAVEALRTMADLSWPSSCGGCDVWGPSWCTRCDEASESAGVSVRPSSASHLLVHAATVYDGPIRRAITVYKDEGRRDLTPTLAGYLRDAIAQSLEDATRDDGAGPTGRAAWPPGEPAEPIWVVPVPSSRAANRRRGDFVLGRVVRAAVKETPGLDYAPILVADRRLADQSGLSRIERRRNVDSAYRLSHRALRSLPRSHPPIADSGGRVVLVDDVVTTGASLAAAASALVPLFGGAQPYLCATIAATPKRGDIASPP